MERNTGLRRQNARVRRRAVFDWLVNRFVALILIIACIIAFVSTQATLNEKRQEQAELEAAIEQARDEYLELEKFVDADDLDGYMEKAAIEEIKSYTAHRYDMQQAFAAEGDDRNPMLVQCAVNITLWLMIHRLPQSMGHERRECLYNDSIKWLKDVQASKARPDLPTYTGESGETDTANPVKYGSCERTNMTW